MKEYCKKRINLNRITDEKLFNLKISDLPVTIRKSGFLSSLIKQVKEELKEKNIKLNLHFYLSDEWFCVNKTSSIAIPFFLAHPRLIALEKKMMGFSEGENKSWALKLLRHEIGHVIDNCFSLKHKKERIKLFGKTSLPYPSSYYFKPYSKSYVKHLESGYAQSHPSEDFAETFAVWLNKKSNWREKYKNWPAMEKLNYINSTIVRIGSHKQLKTTNYEYYPKKEIDIKLSDYYKHKKKQFCINGHNIWDKSLLALGNESIKDQNKFSKIIKKNKNAFRLKISNELGVHKYRATHAIESLILRAESLNLKLKQDEEKKFNYFQKQVIKSAKKYFSKKLDRVVF